MADPDITLPKKCRKVAKKKILTLLFPAPAESFKPSSAEIRMLVSLREIALHDPFFGEFIPYHVEQQLIRSRIERQSKKANLRLVSMTKGAA
jgi:hypothetical protein